MTSGCRLFADKHFGYGGQKFGGVEKVRVEDEMGFYFRLLGKSADELTAQSGFTGAHLADDYIQPPPKQQGKLQFLQTIQMLPGMKKKLGIRRI
jgi:hypothetical protein